MAKQFDSIPEKLAAFIREQHIFFVATAAAEGKVNLSPKGMDSLKILDPNRVIWLNVTGSGNETAAHVQVNPRMTIMFASFDEKPLILRLYGQAKAIHKNDADWGELYGKFAPLPGARQIFDVKVTMVQTSCGFAVPFYEYSGEREQLNKWADHKGEQEIQNYWSEKNSISLDGIQTNIINQNT
jgi:hypothetical protein